jgi:hypothetical protein
LTGEKRALTTGVAGPDGSFPVADPHESERRAILRYGGRRDTSSLATVLVRMIGTGPAAGRVPTNRPARAPR